MENLPSNMSDFKNLSPAQKAVAIIFALITFAVLISAGIWAFPILSTFVTSATDLLVKTIHFAVVAIPVAMIAFYVITHPFIVSGIFAKMSWEVTKFFIKMDRLSVMDRRADYLAQKVRNVLGIKTGLSTQLNIAQKEANDLETSIQRNKELGSAALDEGNKTMASKYGFMVTTDQNSLDRKSTRLNSSH